MLCGAQPAYRVPLCEMEMGTPSVDAAHARALALASAANVGFGPHLLPARIP